MSPVAGHLGCGHGAEHRARAQVLDQLEEPLPTAQVPRHHLGQQHGQFLHALCVDGRHQRRCRRTHRVAGAGSATSTDITLAAGAATGLAITIQPLAAPAAGVAFVPQPVVRLIDSGGNTVTTNDIGITAVLQIVSGGGTLGGTATANTVAGISTWTDLSISATGSYTIRFDSGVLTSVTSNPINVP